MKFPLPPFPPLPLIVMAFTQQLEIVSDCAHTQITLAFLIPVNSCNQKVRTEKDFQSNYIFILYYTNRYVVFVW